MDRQDSVEGRGGDRGRPLLRRSLWIAAVALLAALGAALAWAAFQHLRDPVTALDREAGDVRVVRDSAYRATTSGGEERIYRDLTLATAAAGTVRIATSRPASPPTHDLPLAFIVGGLRTGRAALDFVPRHGNNVLAAYEYPGGGADRFDGVGLADAPAIRRALLGVPAQIRAAGEFLRRAPDVDPERTSLLGYSLGALFVPAAQRLAAARGAPFRALVLAYGGADLARLIRANLDLRPALLRRIAARAAATAIRPLEPALHLPHLPGEFLVLHGTGDERIPEASARRLIRLTPEPREVVRLEGAHMGPGRDEVNEQVVRRSQAWLARRGYAELPSAGPPSADSGSRTGSRRVKAVPTPTSLSTRTSPPCRATTWRVISRPSPIPTRVPLVLKPGSKIRAR